MNNLTDAPSEEQNLTERLISIKCLIYRRLSLNSLPMNICQESLPIIEPVNLLLELWLDFLLVVLLITTAPDPQGTGAHFAIAHIFIIAKSLLVSDELNFW